MYKCSIITIYNKDKVMKRCIQSVIDQTVSALKQFLWMMDLLKVAKGEFITFIGADEYLETDLFEKVVRQIQNGSDIDIVPQGFIEWDYESQMLSKIPMEDWVFSSKRDVYLDINRRFLDMCGYGHSDGR